YLSRTELITIPAGGTAGHDFVLAQTTAIPAGDELTSPAGVSLSQNQPNPFNPSTSISFNLPADQSAWLGIYNPQGRLVRILQDGSLSRGTHQLLWDGLDERGNEVGSGIYLYELISGGQRQTRRMVLLK
nr:T9SS type A sorting domain-containing protein [Candidatus Cloacimonadota bacterium]